RKVRHADFNLVTPLNEQNGDCKEGPCVAPDQYVRLMHKLLVELDAMGETDVGLVGPDAANPPTADDYLSGIVQDSLVAHRTLHYGLHVYGDDTAPRPYGWRDTWLTETGASCPSCDTGGTPAQGEWEFSRETGDDILADLDNGIAAVCYYDGYDS